MGVFDKLLGDQDPWEGDPEPMVKAPAVPVRRFPPADKRESYWPADLFFAVLDTPDGICAVFVPMDWWQRNGFPYPDHIRLVGDRPDFLREEPDMECTWVAPNGVSPIEVGADMTEYGYVYNTEFEHRLVAMMNGLRPDAFVGMMDEDE